jgi:hypothetical protein
MRIEHFHQPGGAGFLIARDEEHWRAFSRAFSGGIQQACGTTHLGEFPPQSDNLPVFAGYLLLGAFAQDYTRHEARIRAQESLYFPCYLKDRAVLKD